MPRRNNHGRPGQGTQNNRNRGISIKGSSYTPPEHHTGEDRTFTYTDSGTGASITFSIPVHCFEPVSYLSHLGFGPHTPLSVMAPKQKAIAAAKAARDDSGLPIERSDEAIRAWKIGCLFVKPSGDGLHLMSLNQNYVLNADEKAICLTDPHHEAPVPKCRCGFYCYRSVEDLRRSGVIRRGSDYSYHVLLEIDLLGRVIECDNLYKGERQRIMTVYVPRGCGYFGCTKPAHGMWFDPNAGHSGGARQCEEHYMAAKAEEALSGTANSLVFLTLAEISSLLGVPVALVPVGLGWGQ